MTPIQEEALAAQVEKFFSGLNQYSFAYLDLISQTEVKPWTPTLTFTTPGDLSVTYANRAGFWTRVGPLVYLTFRVTTSAFTHTTASGALQFTGNQNTVITATDVQATGSCFWRGITKANYTHVVPRVSGTAIDFVASGSGQAVVNITATDMPTGGTVDIRGTLWMLAQ